MAPRNVIIKHCHYLVLQRSGSVIHAFVLYQSKCFLLKKNGGRTGQTYLHAGRRRGEERKRGGVNKR
jgi:hypothetical protein